jgi:hypothetical protein
MISQNEAGEVMDDLFNENAFREKVVQAVKLAGGPTNAAAKSGVSKSVLSRIVSGKRRSGRLKPTSVFTKCSPASCRHNERVHH